MIATQPTAAVLALTLASPAAACPPQPPDRVEVTETTDVDCEALTLTTTTTTGTWVAVRHGDGWTFHQLRHRYGTLALAGTSNLLAVSRAMGHASPATTAIYAATADADLDVIAEAVTR
jgi:integrase